MTRAAALLFAPSLLIAEESAHDHDHAGHSHPPHATIEAAEKSDGFHFHPQLNAAVAIGGSSSEKNYDLVQGAHAPIDDGFNLQGIELGALMEFGERVSAQFYNNVFWDRFDGWDSEWEEAFVAVELPGNLSLRGGQFFAPFGYENTLHLHDRAFVEPPVSMIRLLGEEGLVVQGGELSWPMSGMSGHWLLRFGYGQARSHDHGATRELRREAYEEAIEHAGGEDHDNDDEDHGQHHSHGIAGNGGVYDPELAYLGDGFFFGRLETTTGLNAIKRAGLSFAAGENGFGRTTWTTGADLSGDGDFSGRPVWWNGEAYYRAVESLDAAGIKGAYDEYGVYAASGIEFIEAWTLGGRLEWASGNRMSGNERRWRAAANVGRAFHLPGDTDVHTRLQYTYDRLGGYATEHTVWLQFVLNFGGGEHGHAH